MTTTNTEPPTGLWLKTIKRTGKLFISDYTLQEISKRRLHEFIEAHCLAERKVSNGIILKVVKIN